MFNEFIKKSIERAEISAQHLCLSTSSLSLGMQAGTLLGKGTGSSLEFLDHRDYQPGDDVRRIDWNAMARGGRPTIKLYREETSPHLDIIIDGSSSMSEKGFEKNAAALSLAALLRVAALNSGYNVYCWLLKDECRRIEPVSVSPSVWSDVEFDGRSSSGDTFIKYPPILKTGGVRILISDLFWNSDPVAVLHQLAAGAILTSVIQTVSENDVSPQLSGNVCLVDSETGENLEAAVDEALLNEYRQNFSRHQDYWKKCCIRTGTLFSFCVSKALLADFMPAELLKSGLLFVRS